MDDFDLTTGIDQIIDEASGVDDDETSGVDDNVEGLEDLDTGDDDDTGNDDDTGAISANAKAQFETVLGRSKLPLTVPNAAMLMERVRRATAKKTKSKVSKKLARRASPGPAAQRVPPHIKVGRRELVDYWNLRYKGEKGIVQDAFYYDTEWFEYDVEQTPFGALVKLPEKPASVAWFEDWAGDDVTVLGTTFKKTLSDCNLVRPVGKAQYPQQIMLIEGIEVILREVRIQYAASVVSSPGLSPFFQDVLAGKVAIYDDSGFVLPKAIFHDFSEQMELVRAQGATTTIVFNFKKKQSGGTDSERNYVVEVMQSLKYSGKGYEQAVNKRTAGGHELPYLRKAYLWDLDLNRSNAEEFRALANVTRAFALPLDIVDPRGGNAVVAPIKLAVGVQLRATGKSIRPLSEVKQSLRSP